MLGGASFTKCILQYLSGKYLTDTNNFKDSEWKRVLKAYHVGFFVSTNMPATTAHDR